MNATLFGRYELHHKVATGGMAEVFLAVQRGRSGFMRPVVVKRLFRHLADNERVLRLFKNEALLLSLLDHPGLPQVYEFGRAEGQWYIAMEYVRGYSVSQIVQASAQARLPIPYPVACGIIIQAADVLGYAHNFQHPGSGITEVVHRDVTPDNLMVGSTGHVKVLDFGVAQTTEGLGTGSGVITGTHGYMSPEQIQGRKLDGRADVFALGVVLYELTTHCRAFSGTDLEMMTAAVEQEVALPSTVVVDYPASLEAVVLKALAKERLKRTENATALALALETVAVSQGWLVGSHGLKAYMNAIRAWLPLQEELTLPDASVANLMLEEDPMDLGSRQGVVDHFDDDSLLEDIRMLSEPLGNIATDKNSLTLEFGPDALSVDLGEMRSEPEPPRPLRRPTEPHRAPKPRK